MAAAVPVDIHSHQQRSDAASTSTTNEPADAEVIRHPPPPRPLPAKIVEGDAELDALSSLMDSFNWSSDAVETCAKAIMDPQGTIQSKLKGVFQLKQLLCTSREHVFRIAQDVIDSGVLKGLVSFVSLSTTPHQSLCLPAAFCLTNIAAGHDDQTAAVVAAGGIPPCLELLRSREGILRRQAIFCLANIAGSTGEFRRALASHPEYFSSIIYAVMHASDPKVEELAGWNIRNMCVLGGPTLEQVKPGLDFFADQLTRNCPDPMSCRLMLINGTASFTGVMGVSSVAMPTASYFDPRPVSYFPSSGTAAATAPVLRFACETFSWISRDLEGRYEIINQSLPVPLLYFAKFSPSHAVRNHALECISNLMQFGPHEARVQLDKAGALIALSELLADHILYTPQQRIMAARSLYFLAREGPIPFANAMLEHTVVTRDVARKILADRQQKFSETRPTPADAYNQSIDTDARYSEADPSGRDPPTEGESEDAGGYTIYDEVELYLRGEGDHHHSVVREQNPGASTVEIAYAIFAQQDRPEELALREKCGRMLITILARVSEPLLFELVTPELFRLILDVLDVAVELDVQQYLTAGTTGPPGASAFEALNPGEPDMANAEFVEAVLKLLERLLGLGGELQRRSQTLDNPVAVILAQADGRQRLENVMNRGALPFDVVQKSIIMIQKYCQ